MNLRRVVCGLVLALTAAFCLTPLAEVDFFWHLLAGERILATGRVPRVDEFTFTSAGRPWVDLQWLFQAGAAAAHAAGGFPLLDVLKTAIVTSAFALALVAAGRRRVTLAAPILALPGVVAAQERFTLRPEMLSFLFLALLLLILGERRRSPRLLFVLPVLIAIWANAHSLYAAGLAAMVLVLAGDALGRRPREEMARLGGATAASAAATLLTPYGWQSWGLLRTLLFERVSGETLFARRIAEFQSPFGGVGATASVGGLTVLIVLIAVAAFGGRRGMEASDRLLLAAFAALALLARRNMPLLALVAIPCAAPAAASVWGAVALRLGGERDGERRRRVVRVVAAGVCGCAAVALLVDVVSNRFYARDGTQRSFGTGLAPDVFPETSAGLVETLRPQGEAFHDLADGGYLAWRWWPERRTYIDGRLEVHTEALFATWLQALADPVRFEAEARARDIGLVLWSHRSAVDAAPLLRHLAASPAWRLVHVDLESALFLRRAGEAGGPAADADLDAPAPRLLAEAEAAAARGRERDPIPAPLRRLLPRREIPTGETGAALFLALTGRPESAVPLLEDACRRAPWSAPLQYDLGLARSQAGDDAGARAAFEAALGIDSGFGAARAGLALLRLRAGDETGALEEWERAERAGPLPPESLAARAALHAARRRIDPAIADYRGALRLAPGRVDWRADLALLLLARGLPDQARAEARRAFEIAPVSCRAGLAEARVLRATGDQEGALAAARAAAGADPACADARVEAARILLEAGRRPEAAAEVEAAVAAGVDPGVFTADPALRTLLPAR